MTTWIFQANPDTFDIDGYLKANDLIYWTVRQEFLVAKMQIGDLVFLWRAAGKGKADSGVIASAQILQPPDARLEDISASQFWRKNPKSSSEIRVEMQIQRRANGKEIIKKSWCLEDPILKNLLILRMANQTNYLLTEPESSRLLALWANTGRAWNRSESIAGLWAYQRTHRQPISRSDHSITEKVAVRIGRAVSDVHNKIMNFRSIDARDYREGLSGGGEVDKSVWSEFFDVESNALNFETLEDEFDRIWGSLDKRDTEDSVNSVDAYANDTKPSPKRAGQGRVIDPIVRKAIELRAVYIAKHYYSMAGFQVEDTGDFESFDLRCMKDGNEVRVEVKGTTGQGKSIQLTTNEVKHAQSRLTRVDLFIVSSIEVIGSPAGPQALGGIARRIEAWIPADEHLQPATYTYMVPSAELDD